MTKKIKTFINESLKNSYNDFDIRYEEKQDNRIFEDDGFLHNHKGHIRVVYYFGQKKAITKKQKKQFETESAKVIQEIEKLIV